MESRAICTRALHAYGDAAQLQKLVEECAELIDAICKFKLSRRSDIDVIDELADVSIMVEQIAILFGMHRFLSQRAVKLHRLEERLYKS